MRIFVYMFLMFGAVSLVSALDTVVLKNGDSAEVEIGAVTDKIVSFTFPNGKKQTLTMDKVDYIVFHLSEEEGEVFSRLSEASAEELEKRWNDQFANLHRPRARTGRYGLAFADQLLKNNRELDWKRALGIFDRINERAWSEVDKEDAKKGRLRALIRLGEWEQAKTEAEILTAKTEDPAMLIDVRFLMADADFARLKKLEEENPRWVEDDLILPERNALYHDAIDQFLWPFLFYGTREDDAVRGLLAAAEVYAFAGESAQARASLNDAIELYPGTKGAEIARERMEKLQKTSQQRMRTLNRNQTFPAGIAIALLSAALLAPNWLVAQDSPVAPAAVEQSVSALDLYKQGGSFMHILLICSIGTIAVAVYCFIQINRNKMAPKALVDQVNAQMAARDVGGAYSLCQSSTSSYAKVVAGSLLKVNFDRDLANKASMMDAAAEVLDEEEHRQMVWVNYLNIFATLAPMVGLLGTVWGMIEAFDKLATTSGDAKQLAGGIKIAMVTTAGGLIVGIPAMFFYFFFRDKVQGVMTTIQKNASFAIDILSGEIRLEGAVAPETSETNTEAEEA